MVDDAVVFLREVKGKRMVFRKGNKMLTRQKNLLHKVEEKESSQLMSKDDAIKLRGNICVIFGEISIGQKQEQQLYIYTYSK